MTISAITWNIKAGQNPGGSYPHPKTTNLDNIAEIIRDSGASIASLQEIDALTTRSGIIHQAGHITSKLTEITGSEWYYKYITSIKMSPGLYGNTIISKYPLTTALRINLPRVNGHENRSFLLTRLEIGNTYVYAGTFHLGLSGDHFVHARQIKKGLKDNGFANCKLLIGGDLNDVEGSDTYNIMTSGEFPINDTGPRDVCTFQCYENPGNVKIDFWFERNIFTETTTSKVLPVDISDHRPVLAFANPALK